jgi:hypothetical protein
MEKDSKSVILEISSDGYALYYAADHKNIVSMTMLKAAQGKAYDVNRMLVALENAADHLNNFKFLLETNTVTLKVVPSTMALELLNNAARSKGLKLLKKLGVLLPQ